MLKHILSKDKVPTPKGVSDIADKLFKFKNAVFLAQNQPCVTKNFRDPQKALLLMLKHIVSKYEGPTPKGGWDIADKLFKLKNAVF